jgi:hypothetical protein
MVCGDLREWMEAEIFYARGIEIAERIGYSPALAFSLPTAHSR